MRAVAHEYEQHHDDNGADGNGFDPQHEPRGNFHVAPGDERGNRGAQKRQQQHRETTWPVSVAQQQDWRNERSRAVTLASGGDVGQQQTPSGGGGEPRRQIMDWRKYRANPATRNDRA